MKTSKWDMAEFIETKEDVIAHLKVALEENDIDFLLSVINALARSKGMAQIAGELGVSREGLYKSLTPGSNPAFGTVIKTLDTLGFKLNIELKNVSHFSFVIIALDYQQTKFYRFYRGRKMAAKVKPVQPTEVKDKKMVREIIEQIRKPIPAKVRKRNEKLTAYYKQFEQ